MKTLLKLAVMLFAVAMFTACGNKTEEEAEDVDSVLTEEVIEDEIIEEVIDSAIVDEEVIEEEVEEVVE